VIRDIGRKSFADTTAATDLRRQQDPAAAALIERICKVE